MLQWELKDYDDDDDDDVRRKYCTEYLFNLLQNPFIWNNVITNILDSKLPSDIHCGDSAVFVIKRLK